MPSGHSATPSLPPDSGGATMTKLKKLTLSSADDSDDSDVSSSVGSRGERLTGAALAPLAGSNTVPAPRGARRSGSASSTSLTLSISGDEADTKKKGGSNSRATAAVRDGREDNARSPSSSASSSSSSSPGALRPPPPPRPRNLPAAVPTPTTVAAKMTVKPETAASTAAPTAPPSLSGHSSTPQGQPEPPAPPGPSLQPLSFPSTRAIPLRGTTPGGQPRPPPPTAINRVRTFTADPSDSPSPSPPQQLQQQPIASSGPTNAAAVCTRPAEPVKAAHDARQRQRYNRICTDPNAQATTALSLSALRLPLLDNDHPAHHHHHQHNQHHQQQQLQRRHDGTAGTSSDSRCRGMDPADIMLNAAADADRTVAPAGGEPPLAATAPHATATSRPSAPAEHGSGSGGGGGVGLPCASRVAMSTRRLLAMQHGRHGNHRSPSAKKVSTTSSQSTNPATAKAMQKEERDEAAAAVDSTYAPCAAHQRRTAARAAFEKRLESQVVVRDDVAVSLTGTRGLSFGKLTTGREGTRDGWVGDWLLNGRGSGAVNKGDAPGPVTVVNRLPAPQPVIRERYAF